ncbi:hypothetical protein FRC12_012032 [Ceratobasidium sp. 428]|nr:hypothetical protein FRC12_012032 [Ceratobasidium sp. 428]
MSSDNESTHTVGNKYVDIPDENGQLQPWKVLTRPKKLPDNLNIRKAMELDSEESNPDETNRDARERRTANAAKKMIYRTKHPPRTQRVAAKRFEWSYSLEPYLKPHKGSRP